MQQEVMHKKELMAIRVSDITCNLKIWRLKYKKKEKNKKKIVKTKEQKYKLHNKVRAYRSKKKWKTT